MGAANGPSLAPGARALAVVLLIGLVGVLIGRAIWGGDGAVTPATTGSTTQAATPAPAPETPAQANSLDSVEARSVAGLGNCLNDVAGDPAPPDDQQTTSQQQFITILSGQLEQLRELRFRHPVKADFLSGPKIEKRIGQLFGKEPQPSETSNGGADLLAALGAIKPGDDPAKIEEQALKGQVAGLYVPETGELLVRSGKSVNITDTITVVHELDHALTDQALGGIKESFGKGPDSGELSGAYTALIEGDATITMEAYLLKHGSVNDQLDAASEVGPANKAQKDLETYPYYFQRQLLFPYLDGLRFDCALYEQGGWRAVDRAYHHPPKTTAEVMFPERYGEKVPAAPALPKLDKPWKSELKTEVGASDLEWLFAAPGDDLKKGLGDPRGAAGSWNGGQAEVWRSGKQTAVSVALNDRARYLGLCRSVEQWYRAFGGGERHSSYSNDSDFTATFHGPGSDAALSCRGTQVRLGIGPSPRVAAQLAPDSSPLGSPAAAKASRPLGSHSAKRDAVARVASVPETGEP